MSGGLLATGGLGCQCGRGGTAAAGRGLLPAALSSTEEVIGLNPSLHLAALGLNLTPETYSLFAFFAGVGGADL